MIMYKVRDCEFQDEVYFREGQIFKSKKELVKELINYHDIDFTGCDDNDNELSIEEFFKFYNIEGIENQLEWLLDYGCWDIKKIYRKG